MDLGQKLMLSLAERLTYIDNVVGALVEEAKLLMEVPFNWTDLFVLGAIKRAMALSKGFMVMLEGRNYSCAAPMVRMQLDTALRLSALGYSDDPEFAEKVMRGEHLNRMRDRSGQQLRDARLVSLLAEDFPWVPRVYAEANEFIHLSHRPFFGSIDTLNDDDRSFVLHLSASDPESISEDRYYEAADAFWESIRLVLRFVRAYREARIPSGEGSEE